MRYDERIIQDVQMANDIVEIISQYVPLKKSGRNFKGCCPFHSEKTPSFMVHPEKQIFHCFGCSAGGDVFTFLMRYENVTFPEAIRQLAERAHISLPENTFQKQEGPSESEKIFEIYRHASEYYHAKLMNPSIGQAARDYLKSRGFDEAFATEMKLGWAPEEWHGLFEFLSKKGFSEELLQKSGLVNRSPKGNIYDSFRARLLFPITSLQGKIIAFGGRLIDKREGPKYLNSPENPIFRKRRELYGLYYAKKFIDHVKPQILVVEGYFAFSRLYQAGFKNVVATLGTALTEEHVQVLKRFAEEAVVIYDGDSAGQAATMRGLDIFLEGDMNVKLARLEGNLDPDDFIVQKGAEAFRKVVSDAEDFFDYKAKTLLGRYSTRDAMGVKKISAEFLETFSKMKNPIMLDHYLKRLAGLLSVDENSLRSELSKYRKKTELQTDRFKETTPATPVRGPKNQNLEMDDEVLLLGLAVDHAPFRSRLIGTLASEDFENAGARQVFEFITRKLQSLEAFSWPQALGVLQDEAFKQRLIAVSSFEWTDQDREKAFLDCLKNVRKKQHEQKLNRLRRAIAEAERANDQAKLGGFLKEYQELMKRPVG